jgi:hypothetical protein
MVVKQRTRIKQKPIQRQVRPETVYEITRSQLVKVFDRWQKDHIAKLKVRYPRYAEFEKQVQYGKRVVPYFLSLLKEVKDSRHEPSD